MLPEVISTPECGWQGVYKQAEQRGNIPRVEKGTCVGIPQVSGTFTLTAPQKGGRISQGPALKWAQQGGTLTSGLPQIFYPYLGVTEITEAPQGQAGQPLSNWKESFSACAPSGQTEKSRTIIKSTDS